ncbi:SMI1/KNR4 family protein [Undibacterium pigrum]|uniref:SMI1/KNR4 family protein SUKH-1 n=1 Tax=Undibacterium pigrum TaxID=401470 RepID=A0A318IQW4_9BURK|nr:SMI1/KNR4 family protein [Undibacterium pigrum]PXX38496.1 SMI1/KNR4 family protein SUKH-1 [Undibacterium pigrum]
MINLGNIELLVQRKPVEDACILAVESVLQLPFPEAYLQFLKQTNGFDANLLRLYPVDELVERNLTYEVGQYCPNFISIGDDGGGQAILIKSALLDDTNVYLVGHGVMSPEFMEIIGNDFLTWLESGCPLPIE